MMPVVGDGEAKYEITCKKIKKPMNTQIKTLLENIQQWMLDNDYECSTRGSAIYDEITELLDSAAKNSIIDSSTL